MLTGVFNDHATTLQYVIPVAVSVRYTKHPLASEPGLKRHINPVGEEVVVETPITLNVPKIKYSIQYMGKFDLACIIKKHNKNALRLKCYNFRRVNAIVFLFSALHFTPFLYGKILFGILHLLLASIATFDTPPGSNPP